MSQTYDLEKCMHFKSHRETRQQFASHFEPISISHTHYSTFYAGLIKYLHLGPILPVVVANTQNFPKPLSKPIISWSACTPSYG